MTSLVLSTVSPSPGNVPNIQHSRLLKSSPAVTVICAQFLSRKTGNHSNKSASSHAHNRIFRHRQQFIVERGRVVHSHVKQQGCKNPLAPHRFPAQLQLQQTHPYPLPHISISNLAYRNCLPSFPYISVNIFTAIASSLPPTTASPRSAIRKGRAFLWRVCQVREIFARQHSQRASTCDNNSLSVGLPILEDFSRCLTATEHFFNRDGRRTVCTPRYRYVC